MRRASICFLSGLIGGVLLGGFIREKFHINDVLTIMAINAVIGVCFSCILVMIFVLWRAAKQRYTIGSIP